MGTGQGGAGNLQCRAEPVLLPALTPGSRIAGAMCTARPWPAGAG